MKTALMIIDMQKEYYRDKIVSQMDNASEYINAVIPIFRNKNLPIIWVYNVDEEDGVIEGSEGFEFIDSLKPSDDDFIIHKHYGNSFNKTICDKILNDNDIDTVLLTGFCAEYCVLSTYRGAGDLDYFPIILKDGIASVEESHKEFVEKISETITLGALEKVLDSL